MTDQRVASVAGADAPEPVVLSGQMIITEGALFSDQLSNSSSLLFKALAFDVQNLVSSQAFILKIRRHSAVLRGKKQNKATKVKSKSESVSVPSVGDGTT